MLNVGKPDEKKKKMGSGKQPTMQHEKDIEVGVAIAKILTELWSSQKNPGKVYIRGYRVHHGAVGFVGAFASAYFNRPTAYGFFKHLMDDDRHDSHEWFSGERLSSK
jgi:hypothetical protein